MIPNVVYTCRVNFHLNLGVAENVDSDTDVDLSKFKPLYYTSFASFDGVDINEMFIREAVSYFSFIFGF